MSNWSLKQLLAHLHDKINFELDHARRSMGDPEPKGDASESVWLEFFQKYLPLRYRSEKAYVVDSTGTFSEQIDVVVFDRQYTPPIFLEGHTIVPAECVYAVFEAKQSVNAGNVKYAKEKIASVRKLHRTSLPIPSAGGLLPAKIPSAILGGLLAFESEWKPPLGKPFVDALNSDIETGDGRLDIGCIAAHGIFVANTQHEYQIVPDGRPATAFLFELIASLQTQATVAMIDIRAYARWLQS